MLKIVEPIQPLGPQFPDLREGSTLPPVKPATGFIDNNFRFTVNPATSRGTARMLYKLPDIPVDQEYLS